MSGRKTACLNECDGQKILYMPESWDGNPLKKDYEENDERLNWND